MAAIRIDQQEHGYRYGHELLASSLKIERSDQDVIDRLSDMSGPLRPGETFEPYLTAYPLPSRKYYVLTRTWQDLEAPRAGCVLTRSVLVPMSEWEATSSPADFVRLLRPVNRNDRSVEAVSFELDNDRLAPVEDPRVGELVEAIFLENRKPIVMFDAPQAELISLRLLTALWPSLRRNFSVCTLALSPRTLAEARPFDLLFAPKSARTQFSEWTGRRIEGVTSALAAPRHRWTSTTAQQIFVSAVPNLVAIDSLGALMSDGRGDESALRLTLLWNELIDKSKHSPTAVLGLLDILNSQGIAFEKITDALTPLMEQSVERAISELPPAEAWTFLIALIGKFAQLLPPRSVIRRIRQGALNLTKNNLGVTIEFIASLANESRPIPAVISAGVGEGLVFVGPVVLDELMAKFQNPALLSFIAYSRGFAALIARSVDMRSSEKWVKDIVNILNTIETDLRSRARRNLLPYLDNAAQERLLEVLLVDVSPKQLSAAVFQLWKYTKFSISSFDRIFQQAARSEQGIIMLRDAILTVEETEDSNRFLLSTLHLNESDVRWLCSDNGVESKRVVSLLIQMITQADDQTLLAIARQSSISNLIIDTLIPYSSDAATQIARVLVAGRFDLEKLLDIGQAVLVYASEPVRTDLANSMLLRGLAEGRQQARHILTEFVGTLSTNIDSIQVVHAAIPPNANWSRISDNVVLLGQSKGKLRDGLLWRIDMLTDRLVSKRGEGLSNQAFDAWAELLAESGRVNKNAQIAASEAALPYALRHTRATASPLVMVTFPIVYEQLKTGIESRGLLSIFSFRDWDRCRTARENLVRAFMQSSWPPVDLLLTAKNADDSQSILECISREFHGQHYIDAIVEDVARLPESQQHELVEILTRMKMMQASSQG